MIVLDPGHGGHAPAGASTPLGATSDHGFSEKDLTLEVCRRLASALGDEVMLTREEDHNLSLADRIGHARAVGARRFVSLHAGGTPGVYVHDFADDSSQALAARVSMALGGLPLSSGPFAVLSPDHHRPETAACLVELGHLDHYAGRSDTFPAVVGGLANVLAKEARVVMPEFQVTVLGAALDYSSDYDRKGPAAPDDKNPSPGAGLGDVQNFVLPPQHVPHEAIAPSDPPPVSGVVPWDPHAPAWTGGSWLVLFNGHSAQELNLTTGYVKGTRSLKWGTPYDTAVHTIVRGASAHDNSALLRSWSMNQVRRFVTFICIPPHSPLRFWTGLAAPQDDTGASPTKPPDQLKPNENPYVLREERPGFGVQWRLRGLPVGTVLLTTRLWKSVDDNDPNKRRAKEEKVVDVQARFAECVAFYSAHRGSGPALPANIVNARPLQNVNDDMEVARLYMDPSRTRFKPFPPR